jgi:hypothetical protein
MQSALSLQGEIGGVMRVLPSNDKLTDDEERANNARHEICA